MIDQKLIDEIMDFQHKTFPTSNAVSKLHHLSKEVPELIEELNKFEYGNGNWDKTDMEYADCFLLLLGSAAIKGYTAEDIADFIRRKIEINKKRKWGKPDENGVVQHIKE